jgi:hypothetical protein
MKEECDSGPNVVEWRCQNCSGRYIVSLTGHIEVKKAVVPIVDLAL